MRLFSYLLVALLTLAACPFVWAQPAEKLLIGGQRAGPFTIGSPMSSVIKALGQPTAQQPSSGDPGTQFFAFKTHKLGFLVNPESQVIGVTVARKDWTTEEGLGVGSSVLAFQETYGQGLKRGQGQLAFPQKGLAITYQNGLVDTIYVVKKDPIDAAKGDHLLVGGTRAGEIRVGTSAKDLLKLLGSPKSKEGQQNQIWVYPELGIRLGFIQDRLHMVGVTSGDWVTPSGLKVGHPFSAMKRELGSDYRVEASSVFYSQWGIGARLQGEQIVEILIFSPQTSKHQG